ncbi:MAG: hypothetical protein HQL05_09130 [Nitrospirae bacterium]|uniref:hypothetical protein n=1 Tax=Candidatus Magnetobacterium casense TaxID=1455061 RepID=UPI00058B4930|nr:hypothetical protein [Candidatus Magnetobacterium casensis]MBF0337984.1 hypothetical protein [Nitrospirota bacterium]
MTRDNDDKIKKIEQALIDSFRVGRETSIDPRWRDNVMRDIRGLEVDRGTPSEAFLWRFVTASCCIAVVSCLVAAGVGINPQDSLASLLIGDPLGLITTQVFVW